jgi:predicted phosphodiesterase
MPLTGTANTMRIVCISDTHSMHRQIEVPEGDLLIHAGDCLYVNASTCTGSFKPVNPPVVIDL